ncbi:hypothetical protein [Actinocorallia sp. A-T 12471]|uniref:hypothetical protein n=1 Tax=Actinocorallia sp. A-T 12471 TaxID=3089813 RepID=UPI0029D4053A|nr:hypothetical protein [Actinocorallia sp. A-T 12471]MDX6741190.1 hypothetical protein [Actinocorallia sp. A-T 12471]
MESNCLICGLDDADPSDVVFRDDDWSAEVVPGYDVPGWYFLRARRHAERITGLDDRETATFGRRASDLVAAVTHATGAEATYLLAFGEAFPHFHVLVTARTADVPADRRAGEILKLRDERADRERARELVPAVRKAYADIAARQ